MRCTGVRGLKSCVQARKANSRRTVVVRTYCQWRIKLYGLFFILLFERDTLKENQDNLLRSLHG